MCNLIPTPDEGICQCGKPFFDHNGLCSHGRSYFTPYRPVDAREKNMIDRVLSGQEPAEAYSEAGLNPVDNPEKRANSIMKKDQNQRYLAAILDDAGATDEKIARTLAAGMDANKVKYRKTTKMEDDGNGGLVKVKVLESLQEPDMPERRQSAMAAAELKGHRKVKGEGEGSTVVRVFSPFSPQGDRTSDIPEGLAIEVRHEH